MAAGKVETAWLRNPFKGWPGLHDEASLERARGFMHAQAEAVSEIAGRVATGELDGISCRKVDALGHVFEVEVTRAFEQRSGPGDPMGARTLRVTWFDAAGPTGHIECSPTEVYYELPHDDAEVKAWNMEGFMEEERKDRDVVGNEQDFEQYGEWGKSYEEELAKEVEGLDPVAVREMLTGSVAEAWPIKSLDEIDQNIAQCAKEGRYLDAQKLTASSAHFAREDGKGAYIVRDGEVAARYDTAPELMEAIGEEQLDALFGPEPEEFRRFQPRNAQQICLESLYENTTFYNPAASILVDPYLDGYDLGDREVIVSSVPAGCLRAAYEKYVEKHPETSDDVALFDLEDEGLLCSSTLARIPATGAERFMDRLAWTIGRDPAWVEMDWFDEEKLARCEEAELAAHPEPEQDESALREKGAHSKDEQATQPQSGEELE